MIINPAKCVFGQPEVEFLDYLVNSEGIRPLAAQVQAIRDYRKGDSKVFKEVS